MEGLKLNSSATGLLVIDMQNGFLSPRGSLSQDGEDVGGIRSIIPNVVRLVKECQERDIQDF